MQHPVTGEHPSLPTCPKFWKSHAHRCLQASFRDCNMLPLPESLMRCLAMTYFNHSFLLLVEMPFLIFLNFCFQWTALPEDPFQPAQSGLCWVTEVPSCSLSPPDLWKHYVTLSSSSPHLPFLSKGFRFGLWDTGWTYPSGSFFSCSINMWICETMGALINKLSQAIAFILFFKILSIMSSCLLPMHCETPLPNACERISFFQIQPYKLSCPATVMTGGEADVLFKLVQISWKCNGKKLHYHWIISTC